MGALSGEAAHEPEKWRAEFPHRQDADDLVSRRELLALAVYTSGALFVGTGALAVLGRIEKAPAFPRKEVARVPEVRESEPVYFRYPGPEDEAVLLRLAGDRFVAYSQTCTHLSCAVYYQKERARLYCPCHEGAFDPRTGDPIAGPPRRRLPEIVLEREGDVLYAVARRP
jgi:Rieske Fe-S protein